MNRPHQNKNEKEIKRETRCGVEVSMASFNQRRYEVTITPSTQNLCAWCWMRRAQNGRIT
jgi:hypothetical protein